MNHRLSVDTTSHAIAIAGEIDDAGQEELVGAVEEVLEHQPPTLTVDFTRAEALGPQAVEGLVGTARRCSGRHVPLDLRLRKAQRQTLERGGLWWLGLVDYEFTVQHAIERAILPEPLGPDAISP
ncbi:MAG: STAS domain-containing protein [Actinomycetota bacterium]